jgi:hypothetical protein
MRDLDGCWLSNVRLQLTHVSIPNLMRCSGQLNGVHHLTLVRSAACMQEGAASGGVDIPSCSLSWLVCTGYAQSTEQQPPASQLYRGEALAVVNTRLYTQN